MSWIPERKKGAPSNGGRGSHVLVVALAAAPGCLDQGTVRILGRLNSLVAIRAAVQLVGAVRGVACSALFRTRGRRDSG